LFDTHKYVLAVARCMIVAVERIYSKSYADDLCNFHLMEFHQQIKMLHKSIFESSPLSESGKLSFNWLTIKVICT